MNVHYRMASALVLVAPELLAQAPQTLAATRSLATIAAYAGKPRIERGGLAKALFAALRVDPRTPVAPLALLGAGGDPRADYVLRADPVHLVADRERGLLVRPIDDLSADEALGLVRMLDRHFAGDDLRFEAVRPDAWFARRREPAGIATTPPDVAQGQPLAASMPSGPDSGTWKRWQNEIEMMLFEHPVNGAREARGAPAVNAVWFSGGGRLAEVGALPPTFATGAQSSIGDLARGLARAAGTAERCADIAHAVARANDAEGGGNRFVVAVLPRAIDAQAAESTALAPALELLARGTLSAIHLVADGHGAAAAWTAKPPGAWRRLSNRMSPGRFRIPAAGER